MSEEPVDKLAQFIETQRLKKEAREGKKAPSPITPIGPDDLIPEAQYEKKPEDNEIDRLVDRIGIVEAYNRWCGKMRPVVRPGQVENIMCSCPLPGHKDDKASAWMNNQKNTWRCGVCIDGGDVLDLAAIHFGYKRPDYKVGRQFHELRRDIAKDYGYVVQQSANTDIPDNIYLPEPEVHVLQPVEPVDPEPTNVTPIRPIQEVVSPAEAAEEVHAEIEDFNIIFPTLDWRQVVTPGTFLESYMHACIIDDAAEEYHFWNGMLAIGLAVGRDITLFDTNPVYANILLCVLGKTGDRKTRSLGHLRKLLNTALPFDRSTGLSTGVKTMQSIASGEQLIAEFDQKIPDPTNPKILIQGAPIRGLTMYAELSGLIGRAARQGAVIKDTVMQFADCDDYISTSSRTGGHLEAIEPYMSAVTTTQPESLKDLVTSGDNTSGFLNRWIFASGKAKPKIPIGGEQVDITPCVDPLQRIHGQPRRELKWTEGAHKLFSDHCIKGIYPNQSENPILGRLDLLEKKLCLLLSINEGLWEVTEDIVTKVIKMHGYLIAAYGLTAENMVYESENNKIYNDIVRQIQRMTPKDKWGPTAKNIKDRLASKKYDKVVLQRMFDLVAKDDRVEINQGDTSKPGRHTDHYRWVS